MAAEQRVPLAMDRRYGATGVPEHRVKIVPAGAIEKIRRHLELRLTNDLNVDLFADVIEIGLSQVGVLHQALVLRFAQRHGGNTVLLQQCIGARFDVLRGLRQSGAAPCR